MGFTENGAKSVIWSSKLDENAKCFRNLQIGKESFANYALQIAKAHMRELQLVVAFCYFAKPNSSQPLFSRVKMRRFKVIPAEIKFQSPQ